MAADYLWLWDNINSVWVKAQCDPNGKLLISDLDPFTVQQTTPENLKHVPHGYYAVGDAYLPLAVDANGVLQTSGAAALALDDLTDVDLTGLADGDFIYYDDASGTWKRIAHKDATTGIHGVGAQYVAKTANVTQLLSHNELILKYGARAYLQANQNINYAVNAKVLLNVETFDIGNNFDNAVNYRFTAPVGGYYLAVGQTCYQATTASLRYYCRIFKNNAVIQESCSISAAGVPIFVQSVGVFVLAINDYLELFAYHEDSNTYLYGGVSYNFLTVMLLGIT